ncbi:MAG: NifB/NifX family molybdenum-iron cluster-binding protein [Geoalkalibacter sp.]|uniref:NifB/NifX family molybdenum-iron cluster-binding protein n=1 Tax=Geoalkalibacter sp. TaxID=3041440 RepID=UPI003D152F9E
MLIAVTSKSGNEVDQHFGHAERFLIYDYDGGNPEPLQEVKVEKYCSFDSDHPFRHRQFDAIVMALKDCHAVVTVMIGELPKQELQKVGITPIVSSGPISAALKKAHDQLCGGDCGGVQRRDGSCRMRQ